MKTINCFQPLYLLLTKSLHTPAACLFIRYLSPKSHYGISVFLLPALEISLSNLSRNIRLILFAFFVILPVNLLLKLLNPHVMIFQFPVHHASHGSLRPGTVGQYCNLSCKQVMHYLYKLLLHNGTATLFPSEIIIVSAGIKILALQHSILLQDSGS